MVRMIFLQLVVLFILLRSTDILGQLDLSPQEIQYVADHLTDEKCDELIAALHEKRFFLQPSHHLTRTPSFHTEQPCVERITSWVKGTGRNMTYDYLALRLKEIGLSEVSDRLAQAVMSETANELHMYFLDNPFRDMIPTKSIMLDKPEKTIKLLPAVEAEDNYDKMFIAVLVLGTLALMFCLPLTVCLACPRACHLVCLRTCPSFCSLTFEFLVDGCHRVWYGSKKTADKYLFVAPNQGGGGMMV